MTPSSLPRSAVLTIDLAALVANWRLLARLSGAAAVAAVVKADAYGLGARQVVPALAAAGCHGFFVAHLEEAMAIADLIPPDGWVAVLNGLTAGTEEACADGGILPVLNTAQQARRWQALARAAGRALPAMLQVDSGMSRLGMNADEAALLAADSAFRAAVPLRALLSHLANADDPADPASEAQRQTFETIAALFPGVPRSLANSGGCLMGPAYGKDIARAGIGLYGAQPSLVAEHRLRPVVRLEARIIQIRTVPPGARAGYGLTWQAERESRLATLGVGYADGWPRSLSHRGAASWQGHRLPIAGRVSMDSTIVDITDLPAGALAEGDLVELIGPDRPIDQVAAEAGTIAYEILTSLGDRYARDYRPADAETCA